jgi:hypothetical protein
MKKAFGTIWHSGILYKLSELEFLTRYIKLIASLLTERKLNVLVEGEFSTSGNTAAGVPQGTHAETMIQQMYSPPSLMRRPHFKICITKSKQKSCSSILRRLKSGMTIASKGQQQFNQPTDSISSVVWEFQAFQEKTSMRMGTSLKDLNAPIHASQKEIKDKMSVDLEMMEAKKENLGLTKK